MTGGESHHCGFESYRVVAGLCCARLLAASTEWPEPRVTIRDQQGVSGKWALASLSWVASVYQPTLWLQKKFVST